MVVPPLLFLILGVPYINESRADLFIDRIVQYASPEMQNREFKMDFGEFKKNLLTSTDLDEIDCIHKIDTSIDEFLESHGVKVSSLKDKLKPVEID